MPTFRVKAATVGYTFDFLRRGALRIGAGGNYTWYRFPEILNGFYGERPRTRIVEGESRQGMSDVARQHQSVGRHDQEAAAPPVHARLGELGVVVGGDEQDLHAPLQPAPRHPRDVARGVELLARGQEHAPVHEGPAEILRVRELQSIGAEGLGQGDHVGDAVQVLTVQHHVEGEREPELLHPAGHLELAIERAQSRDTVRRRLGDVLDRDLHVVEAERFQSRQPLAGERDPAGDQVGVEIEPSRAFHQRFQIVAQQRLATREIELHDSERLRLAEHTQPVVGGERVGVAGPVGRIRAVRAAQRAAIGQLGDERVGARLLTHGRSG